MVRITKEGIASIDENKQDHTKLDNITTKVKSIYKNIFISYAKEDLKYASRLYSDLNSLNLNPWLDTMQLKGGQKWEYEIVNAIRDSKYFLPLFSSNSVQKRGFVQKEFRLGLDTAKTIPEKEIFIIPIKIDPCEIHFQELQEI